LSSSDKPRPVAFFPGLAYDGVVDKRGS